MTFNIKVTANSGQLSVTGSGTVPDGEFDINGHEDDHQVQLGLEQRSSDGRYVTGAQHQHSKVTD